MLNANQVPQTGGGKYPPQEPKEVGTYPGRLVHIIGKGLFPQDPFTDPKTGETRERNPQPMLTVTYELSDEFILDEDGNEITDKPIHIHETFPLYNIASERAKSTKRYNALDPKNEHKGNWAALVGAPAMISLTISKKPNAQGVHRNYVGDVSTMTSKAADKLPALVNQGKVFDPSSPDMEVFWSLPNWLQGDIKSSLTYGGSDLEKLVEMGPPSSDEGKAAEDKPEVEESEW